MITFACDCGKELRARDDLAGKKTRCPQCSAVLRVPAAEVVTAAGDPDLDLDDSTPYGLMQPDPNEARLRSTAPVDESAAEAMDQPPAPSTYHSSPREPATRFRPATGRPTAAKPIATKPIRAVPLVRGGGGEPSLLEYTYLLLVFALIPLAVSLLGKSDKHDIQQRFAETIENAPPEEQQRIAGVLNGDSVSLEDAINAMPGSKLHGAHLARTTSVHWLYAALAAALYLSLLALCFSVERANLGHLFGIGAFTATVGIAFLLFVQLCANFRLGGIRGRGAALVIFLILFFIGWSYASANDPESNFLISAFGFTFGVGFCEEFTKAIPLFIAFRRHCDFGWRTACLWGLASGIGFGVSEGIMYSSQHYNGIAGIDIYLVRFVSCVALHAMWSASVGIAIARNVEHLEGIEDVAGYGLFAFRVMAVPMVLHGFYDTLLKKDMNAYALLVALLSFAWLAWHVELARGANPAAGRLKVAKKWAY